MGTAKASPPASGYSQDGHPRQGLSRDIDAIAVERDRPFTQQIGQLVFKPVLSPRANGKIAGQFPLANSVRMVTDISQYIPFGEVG